MPESIVEQILAGFKTDLEAIAEDGGTTYWYTPDIVTRCDVFSRDLLVSQHDTIYLIRDTGDERPTTTAEFGEDARDLDVWIQLHTQDKNRGETDPHRATTLTGTLRNRMIRDVTKKINSDHMRGGLAMQTNLTDVLRDLAAPEGWIGTELLFTVTYNHELESP
jgi:hypothetical protein